MKPKRRGQMVALIEKKENRKQKKTPPFTLGVWPVYVCLSLPVESCLWKGGCTLQSGSLSRSCCGITVPLAFAFLRCVMSTNTTFYKYNQDACHENNGICGALPCWWTGTSQCSVTWIELGGRHVRNGFVLEFIFQCEILVQSKNVGLNEVHVNLTLLMVLLSVNSHCSFAHDHSVNSHSKPGNKR